MRLNFMLAVVLTFLLLGCGAKSIEQAMKNAKYSKKITISTTCFDAYYSVKTSRWVNPVITDSIFNSHEDKGMIWYGSGSDVFAVIEFLSPNNSECNVNFYQYAGVYRGKLISIEEFLTDPNKK